MVKLLKDKFEIKVSESTIRRALQEHEYHYTVVCKKKDTMSKKWPVPFK